MMVTVYRVEDPATSLGPYGGLSIFAERGEDDELICTAEEVFEDLHERHGHDPENHPGPKSEGWEDLLDTQRYRWKFGFSSLDELKDWFDEDLRERLALVGFVISAYTVDSDAIIHGKKQCLFEYDLPSTALVERIGLHKFLPV